MDERGTGEENVVQNVFDHFSDADRLEIYQIFKNTPLTSSDEYEMEAGIERVTVILNKYLEQPHLLDPHLEDMMEVLIGIVKDATLPPATVHLAFKYLYQLTKVRGPKYMTRLFSHEVADVELVLQMLMRQNPLDFGSWETRYVLLLWLSIACMIPFDMIKLDGRGKQNGQVPIMDRILNTAKLYLDVSDSSRDAAGFLIGKFMSRQDVREEKLAGFIDWCLQRLSGVNADTMIGMISLTGLLSSLASVFKHGTRDTLLPYAPLILKSIVERDLLNLNNTLLRKLGIKVVQRLGLTFLKPRIASWRYQRGNRSLTHNVEGPSASQTLKMIPKANPVNMTDTQNIEEEEYDIPEVIEEVLELLLTGLRDKDTVVRWSAAKGIGRITGQLPKELADEVVGSLLEFFTARESASAWHGGCLALAELGRRGLLLPQRLPEVVPVVLKALIYDRRHGACSVGSHVRDAACYVCWSFARAYDPKEMKDYVQQIASALIITTIFDREVNCRRAASAAFQENVGRQGTFPHGIDILTTADYFAVGNQSNCYLKLSVYVAQFEEYTQQLIDHLVEAKLSHWDSAIRELAASALHNLTSTDMPYIVNTVLPRVLEMTNSFDLYTRHGSILAAAEIVYALYNLNSNSLCSVLNNDIICKLRDLVPKLLKERQFRGTGGDLMRLAVCKLIERLSLSRFPWVEEFVLSSWLEILDDTLPHTEPMLREESSKALNPFCLTYYQDEDGKAKPDASECLLRKYLEKLKSDSHFDRMGFSLGIGALPKSLLVGNLRIVLDGLMEASTVTDFNPGVFAEPRRDALLAMSQVCTTVGLSSENDETTFVCAANISRIYNRYFSALKDYTTDSRGDVGAWVREAAMTGLEVLTKDIVLTDPKLLPESVCKEMMCNLLQQSFEKIDRTREHAGGIFLRLLQLKPKLPHIPCREELLDIFVRPLKYGINWKAPSEVFPLVQKLLPLEPYRYHVCLGLLVSAGGLAESLVRHSSDALLDYVTGIDEQSDEHSKFCDTIIKIFEDYKKNDRIIIPLFKVLDLLISNGCFDKFTEDESYTFPMKIFKLMQTEILKCPYAQKLLASINVFCGLIQFPGETRKRALSRMMMLLGHKFPRVRKEAAEQLYLTFIGDTGAFPEEVIDKAVALLSDTQWDSNIETVRQVRNELCDLFEVQRPTLKVPTSQTQTATVTQVDQLESYRDLVSRHDY